MGLKNENNILECIRYMVTINHPHSHTMESSIRQQHKKYSSTSGFETRCFKVGIHVTYHGPLSRRGWCVLVSLGSLTFTAVISVECSLQNLFATNDHFVTGFSPLKYQEQIVLSGVITFQMKLL